MAGKENKFRCRICGYEFDETENAGGDVCWQCVDEHGGELPDSVPKRRLHYD